MKLATLNNNTRDGELLVGSTDLKHVKSAKHIAPTLQHAFDNWNEVKPELEELYKEVNQGGENCDVERLHSPLPRAYAWADGSAYVNHVELVRKARGAEMPESFWHDPLMYQGGSDSFLAPTEDIQMADEAWGIDFEGEVAVITSDVPMGISADEAEPYILGLMLVNDVSLRNLIPGELAKGFGFFQSKPSSSFSPFFVTPDELRDKWKEGRVHLPLSCCLNNTVFGEPEAGVDMVFNFYQLIAHAAKSRPLAAGTIIGSGTVSNKDRSKGSACIAEKRMLEIIESGEAKTGFMKFGDCIRIEMYNEDGNSIFGAIDQKVVRYAPDAGKRK